MRSIINIVLGVIGVMVLVTACEKPAALPLNKLGNPVYLTSSTNSVTPTPAD